MIIHGLSSEGVEGGENSRSEIDSSSDVDEDDALSSESEESNTSDDRSFGSTMGETESMTSSLLRVSLPCRMIMP